MNNKTNIKIKFSHTPTQNLTAIDSPEESFALCQKMCGDFMVCINELCDSWMLESISRLAQNKKLYRQEVKQDAKLAKKAIEKNIEFAKVRVKVKFRSYYYEYVDAYVNRIDKDVKMLYWTIRQALLKANCGEYSEMFAFMETTRILLEMSTDAFDELMKDARRRSRVNLREAFVDYYPCGAYKYWDRCCHKTFAQIKGVHVNLNDSPEIETAYRILYRRFAKGEFLDEAACDCLENNYDIMNDEEKAQFDKIRDNKDNNNNE